MQEVNGGGNWRGRTYKKVQRRGVMIHRNKSFRQLKETRNLPSVLTVLPFEVEDTEWQKIKVIICMPLGREWR